MATVDLNVSPYYDDYDPSKDYLRVLFRPGFAVQARELTQAQTILQEQIKRFGDHTFKNGSRVTDANFNVDTKVYSLNLVSTELVNFPATAAERGVIGTVDHLSGKILNYRSGNKTVRIQTLPRPAGVTGTSQTGRVYFKYEAGTRFDDVFADGVDQQGFIYADGDDNNDTNTYWNVFSEVTEATIATIEEGVYYLDGFFTRIEEQSVVISNTSQKPTAKVGFVLQSRTIDANEDATLYDNARGSSNEGAPGANRLQNKLQVSVRSGVINDPNFYEVVDIVNGVVQHENAGNPLFNELAHELARRTYDESGDYTLGELTPRIEPHDSDANKFILNISKGKAYVRGYEINILSDYRMEVDRSTQTQRLQNVSTGVTGVPYIDVNVPAIKPPNFVLPGFNNDVGASDPHVPSNRLLLRDGAVTIGWARPYGFRETNSTSGRLYMYDIKMFQTLTLSTSITATIGDRIGTGQNSGYFVNQSGNQINVISSTGQFAVGATINVNGSNTTATVTATTQHSFNAVDSIEGTTDEFGSGDASTFVATIPSGNMLMNATSSLFVDLNTQMSSTVDGDGRVFDNNFEVLHQGVIAGTEHVQGRTWSDNEANGDWLQVPLHDNNPINKRLRFATMRVRAGFSGIAPNYGWRATDREISLLYPDVYRVYGVVEGSAQGGDFANFDTFNIGSNPPIVQGSRVKAASGAEGIVVLSNTITLGLGTNVANNVNLVNSQEYHQTKTGTGSTSQIQVITTSNTPFAQNDILTIVTPDGADDYGSTVTIASITSGNQDRSSDFLVDDGQRKEYYDVARLVRRTDTAPNNDLVVAFSYWEAETNTGHYYSVDSYPKDPDTDSFWNIDVRYFNNAVNIRGLNPTRGQNLRNVLDFRLRTEVQNNTTRNPFEFNSRTFEEQSHILPESRFVTDYDEFVDQRIVVSLSSEGRFIQTKGEPGLPAKFPSNVPENVMQTHRLSIPAATRYPDVEVEVETVDNRRYTMRDIGEIDARVRNMEEVVSLSLLESQALNDDLGSGLRTGFIVDDFSDPTTPVADRSSPEFKTAYIRGQNTLAPSVVMPEKGISFDTSALSNMATSVMPVGQLQQARTGQIDGHYLNSGLRNVIKSYDSVHWPTCSQEKASDAIRINPFATWIYNGLLDINPPVYREVTVVEKFFHQINEESPVQLTQAQYDALDRSPREVVIDTRPPVTVLGPIRRRTTGDQRITSRSVSRSRQVVVEQTSAGTETIIETTEQQEKNYFLRETTFSFEAENMLPGAEIRATLAGKVLQTTPATLVVDNRGKLSGTCTIPADTFMQGDLNLVLSDASGAEQTSANGTWVARAFKTTREFTLRQTVTNFTRTEDLGSGQIVLNVENVGGDDRPAGPRGDPIAQTFQIPNSENALEGNGNRIPGAFITEVGIFFERLDTRGRGENGEPGLFQQVELQIRNVVNGYPGPIVLGTSGMVDITQSDVSANATTEKRFRLKDPTYIPSGQEHCIVVLSPSSVTRVWVANQGGTDTITGSAISQQPLVGGYFGSLFKSQNNTTWEPLQNSDLKFNIYRAKFDTTPTQITLLNDITESSARIGVNGDAITTYANSTLVRVKHPAHGMYGPGHIVAISEVAANGENNTLNGIPVSEINTTHREVLFNTRDYYFIRVSTPANRTASGGGRFVRATQNLQYTALRTDILGEDTIILEGTSIDASVNVHRGTTVDVGPSSNKLAYATSTDNAFNAMRNTDTGFINIDLDEYVGFDTPMVLLNSLNASNRASARLRLTLTTNSDYISPVILLSELQSRPVAVMDNNIVDVPDLEEIETGLTRTSVSSGASMDEQEEYASRIAAESALSERAAYLTSDIDLNMPSNTIRVNFDADMQPESQIDLYYKVRSSGDDTPLEQIDWVKFPDSQLINETNYGRFSSAEDYREFRLLVDGLEEFTTFKVRMIMSANNSAQVPNVRDLRVIATNV